VAGHVFDRHGSLFIRRLAVIVQAKAAYGAGVDYALNAFIEGSLHDVIGAFDVALINLGRLFAPQTIVGCAVINDATTFGGFPEGIDIAKVSSNEFDCEVPQIIEPAGRAHETSNLFAAFEQNSNEMRSNESSSACD
jgi:hypothetical protein